MSEFFKLGEIIREKLLRDLEQSLVRLLQEAESKGVKIPLVLVSSEDILRSGVTNVKVIATIASVFRALRPIISSFDIERLEFMTYRIPFELHVSLFFDKSRHIKIVAGHHETIVSFSVNRDMYRSYVTIRDVLNLSTVAVSLSEGVARLFTQVSLQELQKYFQSHNLYREWEIFCKFRKLLIAELKLYSDVVKAQLIYAKQLDRAFREYVNEFFSSSSVPRYQINNLVSFLQKLGLDIEKLRDSLEGVFSLLFLNFLLENIAFIEGLEHVYVTLPESGTLEVFFVLKLRGISSRILLLSPTALAKIPWTAKDLPSIVAVVKNGYAAWIGRDGEVRKVHRIERARDPSDMLVLRPAKVDIELDDVAHRLAFKLLDKFMSRVEEAARRNNYVAALVKLCMSHLVRL